MSKCSARFASPRHGDGSRRRRIRPDAARALRPDIDLVHIDAAGGVLRPLVCWSESLRPHSSADQYGCFRSGAASHVATTGAHWRSPFRLSPSVTAARDCARFGSFEGQLGFAPHCMARMIKHRPTQERELSPLRTIWPPSSSYDRMDGAIQLERTGI